jgi:WD40 repeat protein
MKILNVMLEQCDKNALVGVVKSLCAMLEEYEDAPEENEELNSEDVIRAVRDALVEKDRNAFEVVTGARGAAGKPVFQAAAAGGRERAPTGLLVVSSDVLSLVSTFLGWKKVTLRREWKVPVGYFQRVSSCHISPCSTMILTSSGNGLHLWDAASGILKRTFKGHTNAIDGCRFFPDGKTVVSASSDRTLKVWDVESGSLVMTLVGHTSHFRCVEVSSDNTRILSGSNDGTWKLWNARTGVILHTERANLFVLCCSFPPNGRLILVGRESNLMLHDSTTYQLQHTFSGHRHFVSSCSFAPGGATILSGSLDCTLKLWSATTGQHLRTLAGHSDFVTSCSFSPSGHAIYSASIDGTLMMWTAATGQQDGIIEKCSNAPCSICASPDGKYIVSGHSIGVVKAWHVGRGSSIK